MHDLATTVMQKLWDEISMKEDDSQNGKSQLIVNHLVDEQPTLVTPEQIKIMDYLFKEVDLSNDEDFEELGREFDE